MYELSANLELLFTEHGGRGGEAGDSAADRVRAAADLGVPSVEIWLWRTKNLDELAETLHATGTALQVMCVEPMGHLVDPSTHDTFLAAVAASAAAADKLGCPYLVVTAGQDRPGVPRSTQHQAIVDALRQAARVLEPYDATLLLENLNSRVDHVGTFLDSTTECLDILDEVASPRVKLLYDLYHSLVMDEDPEAVLAGRTQWLAHVQIADVPGRHEPGTGSVDWPRQLTILQELGYTGRIGLEYTPTATSARSLDHIRESAQAAGSTQ